MAHRFVPAVSAGRHIRFVAVVLGLSSSANVVIALADELPSTPTENSTTRSKSDDAPAFNINEFRVLGNSVLKESEIDTALYPRLGHDKRISDVEAARVALETMYHDRGYGTVFVDIPEQSVEADGIVRLRVTEGRLKRVAVHGSRYVSDRQIRSEIPAAAQGAVPNLPQLQSQINSVNTVSSDRVVVPVLKAGSVPGAVDLTLNVQDRVPLHGSIEVNNQYTADTSPLRAAAALNYDNAFGRFDSASLQYQTSPQNNSQVDVWAAGYIARLSDASNKLALTYIHSSSNVETIGALGVAGKGNAYGMRYIHSFTEPANSQLQSQFSFGPDYKNYSQDVVVSQTSSLDTPITYTSVSGAYSLSGRTPSRLWSWSTSLMLGVPGLGDSRQQFADKCFGCKPNFMVLHMDSSLRQNLFAGFAGVVQLQAQYSADPVISNEQFAIGGVHSVRGYLEAEDLGDVGVRSSIELHAPNYLPKRLILSATPFVFFDAARISYQQPLPDIPSSSALRSYGIGLELAAWSFLYGSLTWSDPLVDGSRTRRGDARWEFVVRSSW